MSNVERMCLHMMGKGLIPLVASVFFAFIASYFLDTFAHLGAPPPSLDVRRPPALSSGIVWSPLSL